MDCTGPKNVLVVDFTGRLFGTPSSFLSRNEFIQPALSTTC